MPATILPKKSQGENPFAVDDQVHQQLVADPSVPQFGSNSNFGNQGSFGGGYAGTTNIGMQVNQSPQQQLNLTQGGSNAAQDADVLVKHDKDSADWINKKWRPAMGWLYMATCTFDFVIFPILWSLLQAMSKGQVTSQWQPLTLQGAGLYHIAMGAVLGIAAYGRTKEKLEGAAK